LASLNSWEDNAIHILELDSLHILNTCYRYLADLRACDNVDYRVDVRIKVFINIEYDYIVKYIIGKIMTSPVL